MTKRPEDESEHVPADDADTDEDRGDEVPEPVGPPEGDKR